MDIRSVSQEEKDNFIAKVVDVFNNIRSVLSTLEEDMRKEDLIVQASAVWISGNLATWFHDFMQQIRQLELQKDSIQNQIQDAVSESEIIDATT
jgi:hypothetical protein